MIRLVAFLITFSTAYSFGQNHAFEEFDFSTGDYTLLGFSWGGSDKNGLADSIGEWFTNDPEILNEFKKEWIFNTRGPQYACGYHYQVYLCKDGVSLKEFYINLNCNEIVTDIGSFYFESSKLRMFQNKLKKPVRKSQKFESITEARDYRAELFSTKELIWVSTPRWVEYEGEFNFNYTCENENIDCLDNEQRILEDLKKEIEAAYPGEKFELEGRGGSNDEVFVHIKCNKSLADQFDLHPKSWNEWTAFNLSLGSYWIE